MMFLQLIQNLKEFSNCCDISAYFILNTHSVISSHSSQLLLLFLCFLRTWVRSIHLPEIRPQGGFQLRHPNPDFLDFPFCRSIGKSEKGFAKLFS